MRVIVCLKREQELNRLLWLSESKSGIYVGYFNGLFDSHASYHQDGTRHFRVERSHHQRWKDVPLRSHTGVKQLMHSSIAVHSEHGGHPRGRPERDELVLLEQDQLYRYDTLAVDTWLSDSASEKTLKRRAENAHVDVGFSHLSHSTWRLTYFPELIFAISFWAANTRA